MVNPVILISGASSGLGRAAALHLLDRGYRVIGGGRRFPEPDLPFETLPLDVCDWNSVTRFVAAARDRAGRIDALVNCAGVLISGALEVMTSAEEERIINTNLYGTVQLCRAVLPLMRAQSSGRIVNISSIAGVIALPFHSMYCASKFAVEGLTECLRYEARPFNIHVSLLEPGDFFTPMTAHYEWGENAVHDRVYGEAARRAIAVMERDCRFASNLELFSSRLELILSSRRPKLRYTAGMPLQRVAAKLRGMLPDSWYEYAVSMAYKLR